MTKNLKFSLWLLVAMSMSFGLLLASTKLLKAYLIEQNEVMVQSVAQSLLPALLANDSNELASVLKALETNPAIERVELISAEGAPLASLARVGAQLDDLGPDFQLAAATDSEQVQVAAPIAFDSLILANLHIAVNLWPAYMKVMTWLGLLLMIPSTLYVAVKQLRIRIRFEKVDSIEQSNDSIGLHQMLVQAMDDAEIFIEYQPIQRMRDNGIYGVEVLVAWSHPSGQTLHVSVSDFMAWLKTTDVCLPVANWIFRTALEQVANLQQRFGPVVLSFNLSIDQLNDATLGTVVRQVCMEANFPSQLVEFEISEALLHQLPNPIGQISALTKQGMPILIDGFGLVGETRSMVETLQIKKIKLDPKLVANLENDESIKNQVQSVIRVALECGVEVMADGVSSLGQKEFLISMGCSLGQGMLISPPLSIRQLEAYLVANEAKSFADNKYTDSGVSIVLSS